LSIECQNDREAFLDRIYFLCLHEDMVKYGKKTQEEVEKQIVRFEHEGRWKNRKQAIAVGLSEARKKGYKTPPKKSA